MAADTNVGIDKFNITNMDRDVMERLGVSAGDALNVAVHYVMIATVVDEADTCIGYRLYDCRYNNVYNYTRASVVEQLAKGTVPIANLMLIDNETQDVISEKDVPAEGTYTLLCTQGQFSDYPKVLQSGELAKGSAETYTYIATADGMMYFVDYKGKVATYPLATERLLTKEAHDALYEVLGAYAGGTVASVLSWRKDNNVITSYLNFPPFKVSNLAWIPEAFEHNPWAEMGTAGAIFKMLYAWVAESSPRSLFPVLGACYFYSDDKALYDYYNKKAKRTYDYASNMTLSSNMLAMGLNMLSMQDVYEKLCTNLSLYGVMRLGKQASSFIRTTCAFFWYQGIFAVKTAIRTVYKGEKVWTTVAMPISNGPKQNIDGAADALLDNMVRRNLRGTMAYSLPFSEEKAKAYCALLNTIFYGCPITRNGAELLWDGESVVKIDADKYEIKNYQDVKPLLKKVVQFVCARENEIAGLDDAISFDNFNRIFPSNYQETLRVTAAGYKEPRVLYSYKYTSGSRYGREIMPLTFNSVKHALFLEDEPEHFYQAYSYYYELNLDEITLDEKDPAQFWVKKCLTTPVGKTIRNQDKMIQRAIGVKHMTLLSLYGNALIIRDKEENEEVPSVMEHLNAGVVHKRGYMQETWYSAFYPWLKDTTGSQLVADSKRTNLTPLICTMGLRGNEAALAAQSLMHTNANSDKKCTQDISKDYLLLTHTYKAAAQDTVTLCDNSLSSKEIHIDCTNIQDGQHRIVLDCTSPIMDCVSIKTRKESEVQLTLQLYSSTETLYLPAVVCDKPYILQIMGSNVHYVIGSSVVRNVMQGPSHIFISAPVTYITPYAFANYESLLSISLPATLRTIPVGLCYSCKNLREVTFATMQQQIDTAEGKQTIEAGAEVILQGAFYGAYKLEQLELPCTTKQILGEAFRHCMALNDFTAVGLTQVANTAFMDTNNYMRAQVAGKVPIETTSQLSAKMVANLRGTEKMLKQQKATAKGIPAKRTTSRKK